MDIIDISDQNVLQAELVKLRETVPNTMEDVIHITEHGWGISRVTGIKITYYANYRTRIRRSVIANRYKVDLDKVRAKLAEVIREAEPMETERRKAVAVTQSRLDREVGLAIKSGILRDDIRERIPREYRITILCDATQAIEIGKLLGLKQCEK